MRSSNRAPTREALLVTSPANRTAQAKEGTTTGLAQRAFGLPRGRGAARLQAGALRRARAAGGAGRRAGRDAAPGGEVRRPARCRAADAVPAHSAKRHSRLVPAPAGTLALGDRKSTRLNSSHQLI